MADPAQDLVTLTIDDAEVRVPKGTTIIEAAKSAGIEIPFYCYHPHLSAPGNCRMCQVEVEGAPKMQIACSVPVSDGMIVRTHNTSQKVKDTQASTLEFILINHPLDCTVCDQAGHCKLQDYHFEYNARPSRFLEEKEHKVKAEPLGPTVMLDGERCIMCTRCIRFCDEITQTSELGMLNRGDRSVIAVNPGKELDNPLSGTVVDLCPVGALTHKNWRFNTRIWYTKQTDSICTGCSTGCNVKVAVRDKQVVQVKARLNDQVNKEWMCDEGRYGFDRFLPAQRLVQPKVAGKIVDWESALGYIKSLKDKTPVVFVAPDLLVEEYQILKIFLEKVVKNFSVAVAYRQRELTDVEKVLISPDYAPNYMGARYVGLTSGSEQSDYENLLGKLHAGECESVLCIGDRCFDNRDLDATTLAALTSVELSAGIVTDADGELSGSLKCLFPGRSVLEKSGLLINKDNRLQYAQAIVEYPVGSKADWQIINEWSTFCGAALTDCGNDRELTRAYLKSNEATAALDIKEVKAGGIDLNSSTSSKTAVNG